MAVAARPPASASTWSPRCDPEAARGERLPDLLAAWGRCEAAGPGGAAAYLLEGAAAVRHLFAVAASLDSEILGEPQVLGQVKESHRAAAAAGMTGPALDRLFEAAYAAAKRVRSETAMAEQPVTIAASAALQIAAAIHGDLGRFDRPDRARRDGRGDGLAAARTPRSATWSSPIPPRPAPAAAPAAFACHYRLGGAGRGLKDADIVVAAAGAAAAT